MDDDDDDKNKSDKFIGFVEVCIHQARDIHNICIYQNQDVYAKFCSTDNPESKISTKVINRGGRNPVFNETLKLGFRKSDSSLRCEIWMLSRIKNYLEDQFLGFTLVPLSDVISDSGKSPREFEVSSNEVFHSHAGFVELSFSYSGITSHKSHSISVAREQNISCDLDSIEFIDQETVKENERMVSEYLSFPCDEIYPRVPGGSCPLENDDNNLTTEGGSCPLSDTEVHSLEKRDAEKQDDHQEGGGGGDPQVLGGSCPLKNDDNNIGAVGGSCPLSHTEVHSLENRDTEKRDDHNGYGGGGEGGEGVLGILPVMDVRVEPEKTVVQEEIVDMYMKGMQQFTDALAKMKLPMDIRDGSSNVEKYNNKTEDRKSHDRNSPRVFYGSGAFF